MSMKTVKKRALKYIISTYGTQMLNDAYDNVESTEMDDRTLMDVEHDISENANTEDFSVEPEVAETVEEPKMAEPEKVEGEVVENDDVPDFMK